MEYCPWCGLDLQCCYHNKTHYPQELRVIRNQCQSGHFSNCQCSVSIANLQQKMYQEVLETLDSDIDLREPRLKELTKIYSKYLLKVISNL